ncbi:gastrula zinc finger protein XlCGF57.1-like isoform X2 [Scophthalmus maximus]|uniref:gastrula zinc finger protein XlCGF57.1-like isoform X2 n=1 Tax=Scophthalmus maximus TaxID=52904 RepID=UPI001FA8DD61|nr:gastrula zinc finger protein XlCGF57.1-like isoform X2 [Scophthalmus maximus]
MFPLFSRVVFAPSLEVQKRSNMFAVQLLRVSVHERIGAAAEDFLLQVEKGEEAARVPALRALLTERLTAAAEEIVGLLEETVAEYEDRVERSEREICRQRRLLDAVLKPEVRLHRADVQQLVVGKEEFPLEQQQWSPSVKQEDPETPHIKEEQEEVWSSQEGEHLQCPEEADIIKFTVKSEEDEKIPQSSQLHQRLTEENREDCGGPEPARNSGLNGHLEPGPEDQTDDSEDDWKETREPSGSKKIKNSKVSAGDMRRSTGEKPFRCCECGKIFRHKQTLKRHMMIHTEEKPYSCSECGQIFRLKGNLQKHMLIHSVEKPHCCSECGQRFSRKQYLKRHMMIHIGEKPFSCRVCNKRFNWNHQQKRHQCVGESSKIQSQTEENGEDCGGPETARNSGPDGHLEQDTVKEEPEHPHIKEEQEEEWSSQEGEQLQGLEEAVVIKFTVKSEEDEENTQSSQLRQTQTEENREDCGGPESARNLGPKADISDEDWKEIREPSGSNTLKNSEVSAGDMRFSTCEKPFSCLECGQRFKYTGSLRKHLCDHTDHTYGRNTEDKPFSCSECGQRFRQRGVMLRHMLIHTGQKQFSCSECGNLFRQKIDMLRHMMIHTEDKPFSCSECGQRFRQKGVMQRHMLIHTGQKQFSCSECGNRFRQKASLLRHMMIHTEDKYT